MFEIPVSGRRLLTSPFTYRHNALDLNLCSLIVTLFVIDPSRRVFLPTTRASAYTLQILHLFASLYNLDFVFIIIHRLIL